MIRFDLQRFATMSYNKAKTVVTLKKNFTGGFRADSRAFYLTVKKINASKVTDSIYIYGNSKDNFIQGGSGNDTICGNEGKNTLVGGDGNDVFIHNAGDDIIKDYKPGQDVIKLTNYYSSYHSIYYRIKGTDVILTGIGGGSITIKKGALKTITIMDLNNVTTNRIFPTTPGGIEYNNKMTLLTADASFTDTYIDLDDYVSTVTKVNAAAAPAAVSIVGNSKNNSIRGSSSNDTLNGGKGINTLTGGAGSDTFVFNAGDGKTIITDYVEGEDVIQINGTITKAKASGSKFTFTVGGKNLIVKNGASKKIAVVDTYGNTTYYGTIQNVTNSNKAKITATSKVATIDASSRSTSIKIIGNALDNTIIGGADRNTLNGGGGNDYIVGGRSGNLLIGGKGNDTLIGGAGSDTFTGGLDKDIFIHSGGADFITDYKAEDTIQLSTGTITNASLSGSRVVINTSGGSISIKSGKNKQITVVDSSGTTLLSQTFTKTNTSYEPAVDASYESAYRECWFDEDENFVDIDEVQLGDILPSIESGSSMGQITLAGDLNSISEINPNISSVTYTPSEK